MLGSPCPLADCLSPTKLAKIIITKKANSTASFGRCKSLRAGRSNIFPPKIPSAEHGTQQPHGSALFFKGAAAVLLCMAPLWDQSFSRSIQPNSFVIHCLLTVQVTEFNVLGNKSHPLTGAKC